MYCDSALKKAYHQKCFLCRKGIYYSDYQTVTTKAVKYKGQTIKGKTLYLHTKCYNEEYGMNLPIYDPK